MTHLKILRVDMRKESAIYQDLPEAWRLTGGSGLIAKIMNEEVPGDCDPLGAQNKPVRLAALALLVIPIGKVFVYDVFTLKQLYRIIAFIGLGVLLLTSAYLYQRYSKSIRGFIAKK